MEMTLSRRQFTGHLVGGTAIAVAGSSVVVLEGCNAAQWLQTAINDMPVILQIAEAIIQIVAAASGTVDPAALAIAQKAAAEASTDLQLVQTLLNSYNSSTTKNTVLQKIDAALLSAQTNLSGIEGALHITDPARQAALSAGVSAALVIVVALQSIIPAPTPAPATAIAGVASRTALHKALATNDHSVVVRTSWNVAMAAAGGTKYLVK